MYSIKDMDDAIKNYCAGEMIFDLYRLVDPCTHEVYDYPKGKNKLIKFAGNCYEIWNRKRPCKNCVSMRSCIEEKQFVKIEQLMDKVLLIISVPVVLENKDLCLELVKNVSESMVVVSEYHRDNVQITEFIRDFNDLAVKDSFTGLFNKTYVRNELENFIHLNQNTENFLTGVSIDVDNFKKVNDEYGHNVGDVVLQHIAAVIKKTVNRYGGWAGRLGGDEFSMFFINKTVEEVQHISEEMSAKIRNFSYKAQNNMFNVTVSFGVEALNMQEDCHQFLDRIDQSMYAKKRTLIKLP